MSGVLVLIEVDGDAFVTSPDELRAAAMSLAHGGPIVAGLMGPGGASLAPSLQDRFDRVLVAEGDPLAVYSAGAALVVGSAYLDATEADVCLATHTAQAREWLALLAFQRGGGLVTDCVALAREEGAVVATRPVFGGAVLGEFVVRAAPAFASIRAKSFAASDAIGDRAGSVEGVPVALGDARGEVVLEEVRNPSTDGVRLQDARVVVSGGRGIRGLADWHYIEETAAALGAAVGCSRPLVDAGWLDPSFQVGLTGVAVSPDLYVAVGISGASQHLSGISGAKTVVAVNTDPDAPIFKVARFGVVGDYRQVLPAFIARVRELT